MKRLRRTVGALLVLVLIGAVALHRRIAQLTNLPVPPPDAAYVASADQCYFAYGSNMGTRYLYNVRGVLPAHSQPGVIEGHAIGILGSPALAYLMKADRKKAHGVLYRVSKQDLERIKASEGTEYEWAVLPVQLQGGQVAEAQTLLSSTQGQIGKPSRRYQQLLIQGAIEHHLPAGYLAELQGMQSVYIPVISELMGDVIQAVVMLSSGKRSSFIG